MALAKEWTDHKTTPQEKQEFGAYVRNSSQLLDRLEEMLDSRILSLSKQQQSDDFSSPSWAMQQAHMLGKLKAFNEIKRLLNRG